MHIVDNIPTAQKAKTLKDFIPLVLTFFVGLTVVSIYQNTVLYFSGVLDTILNKSFFILLLHHIGFASLSALFLSFVFNLLENKKPNLGFKTVRILLILILVVETCLVTFYVDNYEALGSNIFGLSQSNGLRFSLVQALLFSAICIVICHFIYKYTSPFYTIISRMYPFTIFLFSLFLATLYSEKRPVNENKTQHLLEGVYKQVFNSATYKGKEEYPLIRSIIPKTELNEYFTLKENKPNIKIIIVEGLGHTFVNEGESFTAFMPHLQRLKQKSLYWNNFLSNTGESHAALSTIIGSLPFGEKGFTQLPNFTNRNTLYSILKNNGYKTSFNYGGNSALNAYDRFLDEEKVDLVFDKTAFGDEYQLQDVDAAGISLGYPDKALFDAYEENHKRDMNASLDVFLTLSTKQPYSIPKIHLYTQKVESVLAKTDFDRKTKRLVDKNKELFASFIYTDEAIASFLKSQETLEKYQNTIFIITGSHYITDLPRENALARYRVPLLIYSPLLKSGGKIKTKASHVDIAPTILSMLNNQYKLKMPHKVAWLGTDLLPQSEIFTEKKIPLLRSSHNIQDFISSDNFLSDGDVYSLDANLNLLEAEDEEQIAAIKEDFDFFKSVNTYSTQKNKIIPASSSLVSAIKPEFSKEDMIWIESVFNGNDFDNAYKTARKLALNKDWRRALMLCKFILKEVPRYADAEILMGRLYSWQEEYETSSKILEGVIRKYPNYEDGYCALLDTYYWSDQDEKVYEISELVKKNRLSNELVSKKIDRSIKKIQEKQQLGKTSVDAVIVDSVLSKS